MVYIIFGCLQFDSMADAGTQVIYRKINKMQYFTNSLV
jgi:hypothetical protein